MDVDVDAREATNTSGSGFYPVREEDDDDISMRSPLSAMDDHDMHDDDDEDDEQSDDERNDFEEHHHLHISRRTGGHGTSRRTSSNRLWGSLDSELSILDALDEVDEEEFSYLFMLDDEALFAEEQRRRARLASARNARPSSNSASEGSQQSRSSEDRLESMRDALGLYNSNGGSVSSSSTSGQTLVLTFGDYIEELPDMLDDDFLFESFEAGGRGDRSRRERQLGRPGGNGVDQFTASPTTHPLLRMSGRGDAILLDSNGLLRNPGRFSVPRHSSLLRELQELTDQVQTQLPLGGNRSRLVVGRDMLQRAGAGSRGRPPSRINRLSAVSNLLSEFSLDIPTSTLPSRSQRIGFRRGDRDIFSDVFVGVDLSRGIGIRGGNIMGGTASNPAIWGPGATYHAHLC
ncbi:uncharacterized protein PITG_08024 [Phytophthora infestans T30-4]|uniref:Uncharacterized protein n=1 Tax=Phytophthora infestans (strain T30-4) TaxID=403677 RepID=D0N9A7_PHYIT|nr:uncharacterized protein PITG_08024 [Phytophthora infestans T30-4]EEY54395.1 conserved hypothetical protein [Phytophthora infestans T30-4]|eukprot:XP_002904217.1 conserved hypothetical protein [Phytophthora infestans T30-4]